MRRLTNPRTTEYDLSEHRNWTPMRQLYGERSEFKAVHKILGNFWATFSISGNFFSIQQLLQF